mgnify:CR=1 FL=1
MFVESLVRVRSVYPSLTYLEKNIEPRVAYINLNKLLHVQVVSSSAVMLTFCNSILYCPFNDWKVALKEIYDRENKKVDVNITEVVVEKQ